MLSVYDRLLHLTRRPKPNRFARIDVPGHARCDRCGKIGPLALDPEVDDTSGSNPNDDDVHFLHDDRHVCGGCLPAETDEVIGDFRRDYPHMLGDFGPPNAPEAIKERHEWRRL